MKELCWPKTQSAFTFAVKSPHLEARQLDLSAYEVFVGHRLLGLYFSRDETVARAVFLSVMA